MAQTGLNLALALPEVGTTLLTVFGIGLVIFVHEMGHFLCAKWCGVDVEVFSLGFGPRLWGFQHRGTDYRISAVPVGGYVKMLGDQPGEGEGDPRALNSKSIGQRFLVYSGGVIMNVVFALVAFPLVFQVGLSMVEPAVGAVTPGSPAWHAGLQEGDRILEINGRSMLDFTDIQLEVALGDPNDTVFKIDRGGGERMIRVEPEYSEFLGAPAIGIGQPSTYRLDVEPDGAAALAGLESGDRVVGIDGRPITARFERQLDWLETDTVLLSVERGEGADATRYDFEVQPRWEDAGGNLIIGILPFENAVIARRGVFLDRGSPLVENDSVIEVDGVPVYDAEDIRAAIEVLPAGAGCALRVERDDGEVAEVMLEPSYAAALADDLAFGPLPEDASPRDSVPIRVNRGSPAEASGLATGMRLKTVGDGRVRQYQEVRTEILERSGEAVTIEAWDGDTLRTFTPTPGARRVPVFGMSLEVSHVVRRYGAKESFLVGAHASWNFARQTYLTLRKLFTRQISPENMSGIVGISAVSYHFAKRGVAKLFYFLALLSINLAIINVLPIPVLDGGHLLFLLIEKIKGSPVNDRVMGYSQVLGLMFILSLLIYVTYNDIRRFL